MSYFFSGFTGSIDMFLHYGYSSLMKRASVTDIKNKLSEYLGYVKNGDTVRIYDRSTAVADIVPVNFYEKRDTDARLADLELRGVIRRGSQSLGQSFFNEMSHITKRTSDSKVCGLCLADRRKR